MIRIPTTARHGSMTAGGAALPLLAARWLNAPLMLDPGKADIMARAYGPRVFAPGSEAAHEAVPARMITPKAGLLIEPMARNEPDYVRPYATDGVAVIGVEGVLCGKGKWIGESCGTTSYEGIMAQVELVHHDPMIKGVVFEVDTPGGEVRLAFATAKAIAALSKEKPTIAILSEEACSAGYLLASACRSIIIPETGHAGSIGVITLHASFADALKRDGVDVTILASGARKADMNPYEALPPEVRDTMLADLDALRVMFAEAVAAHRGPRLTVEAALATEAAVYRGSAAVAAGLADDVGDPIEAFAAFAAALNATA